MKKVVSNATPIISLAIVDKLSILRDIFQRIIIPEAVFREINAGKYPGQNDLESDLFEIKRLKYPVNPGSFLNKLDKGEWECILLAQETAADYLIIDERLAYQIAKSQGINVIGTLSVLLMAKNKGLIREIKPILDEMMDKGRWYSQRVYRYFLKSIGEW